MIDITSESALSLTQAAGLLPLGRFGSRPTLSCVLRWILTGVKSPSGELVRLEALRLGGRWVTSREAIQRFAERLTPRFADAPATPRSPGKRRKASDRAARELDTIGI